ncbi:hypothetical protein ZWY2020_041621 [Hordeum vulgare]|nr:hypothetical protein ZWY2020_041621 [Hordeum vulgare]
MGCSLLACQKLLLLVAATLLLHQSSASSGSISMARPGCPDKCGNTSIPFPFGIGKGCFQEPFNVTCNGTGPYLGSNGLRVLDIALTLGEVRVQNPHIATRCNFSNGSNSTSGFDVLTLDPFHTVSNTKNKLTSIGCGGLAMVVGQAKGKNQLEYLTADSCISSCMDVSSIGNGTECSGMGCCQAPVSGNINAFVTQSIPVSAIYNSTIQSFSPCSSSFVAEDDWFKFDRSYVNSTNFGRKYTDGVPLVLDWVVGNGSCSEATKMGSQYACQDMNSKCVDVSNGPGYRCNCSQGYEGNPYLQGGCKDINECEPPNQSLYPCKGNCRNTVGSYTCSCSSGFRSDDPKSIPCVRADPNKALKAALGTSAGVVFLMEGKSLASSFLLAMKEDSLHGILDASILSSGMETLLREVAELVRMCLSTRGEERPSMTQVADKLKVLRSTWREKLVLTHGEAERLVVSSSPAALAFHDPPSSAMFSTGPHMSGIGIDTPR